MTWEEFFVDPSEDEQAVAFQKVEDMYLSFIKDKGVKPTKAFISDNEELQSFMLWACDTYGLKMNRTMKSKSYLL